jgi:hypothetical protein
VAVTGACTIRIIIVHAGQVQSKRPNLKLGHSLDMLRVRFHQLDASSQHFGAAHHSKRIGCKSEGHDEATS